MSENIEKIQEANQARLKQLGFNVWIQHILYWLDLRDVMVLGTVSRQFHEIIYGGNDHSRRFWSTRSRIEFPLITKHPSSAKGYSRTYRRLYPKMTFLHADLFYRFAIGDQHGLENMLAHARAVNHSIPDQIVKSISSGREKDSYSPIDLACYHGHLPMVQYALRLGNQVGITFGLHLALGGRHLTIMDFLIERQPHCLQPRLLNEETALDIAVNTKSVQGVETLLKHKKTVEDSDSLSNTLARACFEDRRDPRIVEMLLQAGAKPNGLALWNLLQSKTEDFITLQLLLAANVSVKVIYGDRTTPLYIVMKKKWETSREVIQPGWDLDCTFTAAIMQQDIDVVTALIPQIGPLNRTFRTYEVFNSDPQPCSPLFLALKYSTVEIYQRLQEAGATEEEDYLEAAIVHGRIDFLRYFLERSPQCVETLDADGTSCLHSALRKLRNNVEVAPLLEMIELLIEANLPLNNNLMECIMSNHAVSDLTKEEVAKLLIRRGVTFNARQYPNPYCYDESDHYDYSRLLLDLTSYSQYFKRVVQIFNQCDTQGFFEGRHNFPPEFYDDAIQGRIPNCQNTPCHQRWLLDQRGAAAQPESGSTVALKEYQWTLFRSRGVSKKQKANDIETASDSDKMVQAVRPRHTSRLFVTRRSILTRGGQKLVREHSEFQTIQMVIEWVEQYLRYLSTKRHNTTKCDDLRNALKAAKSACNNIHSTEPQKFDPFMNSGLADAIQKKRKGEGFSKGWLQFLSIFTEYAARQSEETSEEISMMSITE